MAQHDIILALRQYKGQKLTTKQIAQIINISSLCSITSSMRVLRKMKLVNFEEVNGVMHYWSK